MLSYLIYLFLPLFRQLRIDRQPGQPAAHPDMPIRRGLLRLVQSSHGHIQRIRAERGEQRQMGAAVRAEITRTAGGGLESLRRAA